MGKAGSDIVFIWLLLLGLLAYIFMTVYTALSNIRKSSERGGGKKELIICKVKILKSTYADENMTLYVVEDENKNKHILRCFAADKINIAPGDTGTIKYKGKTIKSFYKN